MFSVQATANGVTSRCESPPPPRENGAAATGFSPAVISSIHLATRSQESTIFARSCNNPYLKTMIELLPGVDNQDKRFSALGMGITAVANMRDKSSLNCDVSNWCDDVLNKNPRDSAHRDNISRDPAMTMRGADLVDFMSFGKNEGLVDTLYAETITVGKRVQEGRISDDTDTLISHANIFLDLVKSSSVQRSGADSVTQDTQTPLS